MIYFFNIDENEDLFRFFVRANDQCEWMWKNYFKFAMVGTLVSGIASAAFSVLLCMILNGHFDVDYLYHPHQVV